MIYELSLQQNSYNPKGQNFFDLLLFVKPRVTSFDKLKQFCPGSKKFVTSVHCMSKDLFLVWWYEKGMHDLELDT